PICTMTKKISMKKIYSFSLAVLLLSTISCKKVLEVTPANSIPTELAFSSADYCLLSLYGVYDAAQSGVYTGSTTNEKRGYPFGAASIEQGDCRGEDMVNLAAFFQVTYQTTYNATSANCVSMWDNLYSLINKANVSIDGFKGAVTKGLITAAVGTQYEAECRFLRALAHHEAVVLYARPYLDGAGSKDGVPYRDFAITTPELVEQMRSIGRPKVSEDYTKILADLDFAEANLPASYSSAILKTTRANKAAAIALKMRVKLHMGDWAGVIAEGNKLIPTNVNPLNWAAVASPIGNWALTKDVDGPFAANASSESIFSIKNDAQDAPSTNAGLASLYGSGSITGGRGLVAISPIIWNNTGWKCTDKRRAALYVTGASNISTTNLSYFTTKYRDYATRGDFAPQIRYAEVLLTLAEAEARAASAVSPKAIILLNTVRNRALADPATEQYTAVDFPDKVALVKAILLERRIEFLAEGKRWGDIHRNVLDANYTTGGIPAKAVNGANGLSIYSCGGSYTPGQAALGYSDFKFIWPIPANEIVQNPIIKQNPLY
ncbi:MAG TPA: RagB/SusD family nutrient uptake outer membrane protein, partial [Niastella sp.]